MVRNVLRLVLAVNSVSKALNRVEKIFICVAVNSATQGFTNHMNSDMNFWCDFMMLSDSK